MKEKLNIANILKDKPNGTKLYADAFGELKLERVKVNEVDAIYTKNKTSTLYCFYNDGKYNKNGEPILVPSKKMRDWSKFAWKKGDVLIRTNSEYCIGIFEEWTSDDYSTFSAKYINLGLSDNFSCSYTCKTEEWEKTEISNMYKKKLLVTISTDADDFNESDFSVKEAINSAIENEAQDNYESPLFDCRFSVKEISDMEQLEDKVNNTLKWLANQIACTQVYKKWDEEYKKERIDDAWQKVQEQFKEDIDWNTLTESQCKALHFGRWQSEEDIEEQISFLKSELEKGHLTKEEFDKKVANERNTLGLRLIPLYLYPSLPIGITLTSIDGEEIVFNGSNIDTDIRFGCIAWGIKPKKD